MKTVKRLMFALSLVAVVAVASFAAAPRQAAADGMTVCDSTLLTLVYIAEHDYGFKPMADLATFEKGQFKSLFDSMMGDKMMATPDAMMAATPDAMMAGTPDAMMVVLKSGAVQGENPACTALRAEVEQYLFAKFESSMMKK